MTGDETSWSVHLSPTAVRALDRLPLKIAAAIAEFITTTLPGDPYLLSKPLRFEFAGWRVARRGDYRVTFRILEDDHVLLVGRIEHRAHVYRQP
ncbi:type II toxin-antitoxin system RelE family toxin [Mycobacterium kyorinense]|uniref:Addiction module toxin RelE n=1 Tax=Mycobacterium kyorinense TaxID=487514 RepID=A0A1X1Y5Q3_9MYCO|nr:type II toxin-antitoxin system RelE/ParE family toxin [Mycobacterium kyorinense]ORW06399.1 addiction module toxin RelE [Mycobacterium kyorinense]